MMGPFGAISFARGPPLPWTLAAMALVLLFFRVLPRRGWAILWIGLASLIISLKGLLPKLSIELMGGCFDLFSLLGVLDSKSSFTALIVGSPSEDSVFSAMGVMN